MLATGVKKCAHCFCGRPVGCILPRLAVRWTLDVRATGAKEGRERVLRRLSVTTVVLLLAITSQAAAAIVTNASEDGRTGWYPNQPTLTPGLLGGGGFGRLWSTKVEGEVYAQPLLADETLIVATEQNQVYGLNPATGGVIWHRELEHPTPWSPSEIPCGDLVPTIGVTSTPVVDTATATAYMTHKTYASGDSGPARYWMDAINIHTGEERPGFPVELAGTSQNAGGTQTFDPEHELQRPGLLLLEGVVYAGFGGECDDPPWQGWVFGVSTSGQVKSRWVTQPAGQPYEWGGGIWQSGAGLSSDGPRQILLATGNGAWATTPAKSDEPPEDLGSSVVRLEVQSNGELKATDFYQPANSQELGEKDLDFASGGVTVLPNEYFGTASTPHLAVAAGKNGIVYLLDRDNLGGYREGPGESDDVLQQLPAIGGVWSRASVWPGEGGWIYLESATSVEKINESEYAEYGHLHFYKYVDEGGVPKLEPAGESPEGEGYGFGSAAPVITSDGTTPGSAIMWTVRTPEENGELGEGAELLAYDATPNGEGHPVQLWHELIGTSSKFALPGVGEGRLYLGTRDEHVIGFGATAASSLSGAEVSFPAAGVGSTSHATATVTANEEVTVDSVRSSSGEFVVEGETPALPAHLTRGQTLTVPLAFTPSSSGAHSATLTLTSAYGTTSQVKLSGSTPSSTSTGSPASPEVLFSPPPGSQGQHTPPVPDAELASRTLTVSSSGDVTVQMTCPATETSCAGTIVLRSLTAVRESIAGHRGTRLVYPALATGTFDVRGGASAKLVLHLDRSARETLSRRHTLVVTATIDSHDPAGATHTAHVTVTLRLRKASKHR